MAKLQALEASDGGHPLLKNVRNLQENGEPKAEESAIPEVQGVEVRGSPDDLVVEENADPNRKHIDEGAGPNGQDIRSTYTF